MLRSSAKVHGQNQNIPVSFDKNNRTRQSMSLPSKSRQDVHDNLVKTGYA